jgi:hypothetical protein
VIKTFQCPADDGIDKSGLSRVTDSSSRKWAGASYAWNWQLIGTPGAGTQLSTISMVTLASKDGTSNTVLFAEKQAKCFRAASTSADQANYWGYPPNGNAQYHPVFAYNNSANTGAGGTAVNWNQPPMIQPNIVTTGTADQCDGSRPSTGHNVCLVCMADGSVKAVKGDVNQKTWQSAILPTDGVPLGSDWSN